MPNLEQIHESRQISTSYDVPPEPHDPYGARNRIESDGDTDSSVDIRYRKSSVTDVRRHGGTCSGRNYNYNYNDNYGYNKTRNRVHNERQNEHSSTDNENDAQLLHLQMDNLDDADDETLGDGRERRRNSLSLDMEEVKDMLDPADFEKLKQVYKRMQTTKQMRKQVLIISMLSVFCLFLFLFCVQFIVQRIYFSAPTCYWLKLNMLMMAKEK